MSDRSKRARTEAANPTKKISTPNPRQVPDSSGDRAGIDHLKTRLQDLVGRSPDKAAIILTEWLKQPSRSSKKRKAA